MCEESFAKWEANQANDKTEHCGLLVEHLKNGDTDGNSDDDFFYDGDYDVNKDDCSKEGKKGMGSTATLANTAAQAATSDGSSVSDLKKTELQQKLPLRTVGAK